MERKGRESLNGRLKRGGSMVLTEESMTGPKFLERINIGSMRMSADRFASAPSGKGAEKWRTASLRSAGSELNA
jgi:hypothetical protein